MVGETHIKLLRTNCLQNTRTRLMDTPSKISDEIAFPV
jgi:hypothetical protein